MTKVPVTIIHFISSLQRGGRERQLSVLAKSCDSTSIRTVIIYLNNAPVNYIKEYGLEKMLVKIDEIGFLSRLIKINKLIRNIRPDIVYTWGNLESVFILLLTPYNSFRFINGSVRHGIRLFRFSHLLRTVILKLSPYVVGNSNAGMKANGLILNSKRFVLYNGIDIKFPAKPELTEKKIELSKLFPAYPKDPGRVYISIANLVPYKDYFTVLKALARLSKKSKIYYIIVGDGPLKMEIQDMINELELEEHVRIMGMVVNVSYFLQLADIMIHSSRGEGVSNAILEAMYTGLPIVASDVGGVNETVFKESSYLFPYKNTNALYDCLVEAEKLIGFNSMDEKYQEHLNRFAISTMKIQYEEIIEKTLGVSINKLL